MQRRFIASALLLALGVCGVLLAQKPFKAYPAIEYDDFPLPLDWKNKGEWTRARLRYPDVYGYPHVELMLGDGRPFPGYWTMDYPRSDRHLLEGMRRLTRIDTRSVEQVISMDGSNDMYDFPAAYAVEPGHWRLGADEAKQLREYLLRGGFLMVDDFHGDQEWSTFMDSMARVFPERPAVDIKDDDPILHVVFDIGQRFQVPGAQYFESGKTWEKGEDGKQPHWRAIYDDKGRVMVAICHNMDLGDAWEHSDEARYEEKWAGLAYKIAVNYYVYDLTH